MIEVTLEWYEQEAAKRVAHLRYTESRKDGKDMHAYGYMGTDEHVQETDIEGAGAEVAAAKALNIYWPGSVNVDKEEPDVGKNTMVRSTKHPNGCLLVRPNDPSRFIYVLVVGEFPSYKVVGWMPGRKCKQERFKRAPNKRPSAYFVPQRELTSIV